MKRPGFSVLAGAACASGLAPTPFGAPPAERVGDWAVEARSPDECAVDRRDSGGTWVFLSTGRGGARTLIVYNPRWPAPDAASLDRLVALRGGERLELAPPGRKVELGAETAARVAASEAIEVVRPDGALVERVDLAGFAAAAARLPACMARTARHAWPVAQALPPVAPTLDRGGRPPRAEAGLPTLFTELDYPSAAIRAGEQGTVAFRVLVGTDGRVSACEIVASSGSATLDSATCALLAERARFAPAEDSQGRPALGFVPGQITWRLPDSEPEPPTPR